MLKALAGCLRIHKKASVCTMILSVLEVWFEILIPLCVAELIGRIIERGIHESLLEK